MLGICGSSRINSKCAYSVRKNMVTRACERNVSPRTHSKVLHIEDSYVCGYKRGRYGRTCDRVQQNQRCTLYAWFLRTLRAKWIHSKLEHSAMCGRMVHAVRMVRDLKNGNIYLEIVGENARLRAREIDVGTESTMRRIFLLLCWRYGGAFVCKPWNMTCRHSDI